ncbi:MAG TPA: Rieske 2Fe-2S domain-containing protein, partial [Phototrophicaceae bacterium]|nr:Rieske 2Fe-2S domain-containing protein [Phototrophicaceae bacterium]
MDFEECIYTGPGTLAGRYLRLFWQPICCAYELQPGQALPIKILGEEFTVYRGASGMPYLVGPRCAHRGTQ